MSAMDIADVIDAGVADRNSGKREAGVARQHESARQTARAGSAAGVSSDPVMHALHHGADMSVPLASFGDVFAFLRAHYLHSRFEGSANVKDFPDYAQTVAQSTLAQLVETGIGCISPYESNSGKCVWFDRSLRVMNPDAPPAQIQKKAPSLSNPMAGDWS